MVQLGDDFRGMVEDAPPAEPGEEGGAVSTRAPLLAETESPIVVVDAPAVDAGTHPLTNRHRRGAGLHLMLQGVFILAAGVAVGLGVFFLVRAAANGAYDSSGDDEAQVEPGPQVGLDDGTDGNSGSRRTSGVRPESNEDGDPSGPAVLARSDEQASAPAPSGASGDPRQTAPGAGEGLEPTSPTIGPLGEPLPTTASTIGESSVTSTTRSGNGPPRPTTTRATATTSTTSRTSTSTSTTTSTSGPATTPTTAATTTTTASTTSSTNTVATVPAGRLIVSPSPGSTQVGTTVRFEADSVTGVAEYCWSFSGAGDAVGDQCEADEVLTLNRTNFTPGSLTVTARAYDDGGTLLDSDTITITIGGFTNALSSPAPGAQLRVDRQLTLRAVRFLAATEYCWVLRQGTHSSDRICDLDGNHRIRQGLDDLGFVPGSMTIVAETFEGGTLIASEATAVTLTS